MLKLLISALAAGLVLGAVEGRAQSARGGDDGLPVFKKACAACHKWHGGGGGGYGGDALSLRKSQLTKEQIVEAVNCGRPGTGMPYHARGAYDTTKCYDALKADMGPNMPPEAAAFLRPAEVEAVAVYTVQRLAGKGEPTLDECLAFFGSTSRACDTYRNKETTNAGQIAPP
jgi:mono/diheme cytochrome c family protein